MPTSPGKKTGAVEGVIEGIIEGGGLNVVIGEGDEVIVGDGGITVGNGEGEGVGVDVGFEEGLAMLLTKTTMEIVSTIINIKEIRTLVL